MLSEDAQQGNGNLYATAMNPGGVRYLSASLLQAFHPGWKDAFARD
jgi:hypothetical protein